MHHGEGLRRLLKDDAKVEAIARDHREAGLTPRQVAMLDYVEALSAVRRKDLNFRDVNTRIEALKASITADEEATRVALFPDISIGDAP